MLRYAVNARRVLHLRLEDDMCSIAQIDPGLQTKVIVRREWETSSSMLVGIAKKTNLEKTGVISTILYDLFLHRPVIIK